VRYLKSVLVGILTGVVAAVIWGAFWLAVPTLVQSRQIALSGSGGLGLVAVDVTDISFLAPASSVFWSGSSGHSEEHPVWHERADDRQPLMSH
jgi:hypothetical protein